MTGEHRSWLFVPADDEKKLDKAIATDADAIIFDLEDSVVTDRKDEARAILKSLGRRSGGPERWVRINPAASNFYDEDVALALYIDVDGIVLPKTESGQEVASLYERTSNIPIHAIVTESPASLFNLLSYRGSARSLAAMSWGAEDLSAALGASSKFDDNGELSFTYRLARSLCLAGAGAAGVQPVDGVFADFRDDAGLKAEAEAARREGFTGKLAIHPAQVAIINAAFTPSAEEVAKAEAIVAAFEAHPNAGTLSVDGKMVDRPHLAQARRLLNRSR